MVFVTAYGPKTRVTLDCSVDGAGRTKQSFKDECDINNIMARYIKTGTLEFAQKHEPRYGDCTGLEFQTCMDIVAKAKTMFAEMPAKLRGRFENEPAKFLEFIQDDKNREEARELGLLKAPQDPVQDSAAAVARPSHREDGSATHEPLRAPDGTFREHTRKEKRAEAAARKAADADGGGE